MQLAKFHFDSKSCASLHHASDYVGTWGIEENKKTFSPELLFI